MQSGYFNNKTFELPAHSAPRFCAEGDGSSCFCKDGVVFLGLKHRIDNNDVIQDFEGMRQFMMVQKQSSNQVACNQAEFGSNPFFKDKQTQCFCQYQPKLDPYRCAESEHEECQCSSGSQVLFMRKHDSNKKIMDYNDA